jgi:hypothetical protein
LPNLPAYTLAIDPNNPATLYLGNDNGVWITNNGTALSPTWFRFGTGLPNVQVHDLELNSTLQILAAGTHGRGMWEISINPGSISFFIGSFVVDEAAGSQTITVERNGIAGTVTVDFATSDGTATAGTDYTATSGTLVFFPGETSKTFTVSILDDGGTEGAQSINLTLSNPTGGATLGSPNPATLTILETNVGQLQFSSLVTDVNESSGMATVMVTRTGGGDDTVTVMFSTTDGTATAGTDYTAMSGTLTFNPGETSKSITIPILDDGGVENAQSFLLSLSNPTGGATLGSPNVAIVTVLENDFGSLAFDIPKFVVDESAGTKTITVTRTGGSDGLVTVAFATSDGTATAGTDYTATSGTLTFNPGETSQTFTIPILDDGGNEGDQTVNLTLSNPTGGATLGANSTALLTIVETSVGQVQFSKPFFSAIEPSNAIITVTRTGGSDSTVTVDFATSDGFLVGAGVDYTPTTGTLTFNPGETSKTFMVPILDDGCQCPEDNQTINLALTNPTGGVTLGSQASAVIAINEPVFVTGPDAGGGPDVRVWDQTGKFLEHEFLAYDSHFLGGVRVATGDINGDGIPDIITVPGPGGGPDVRVFDGQTGKMILEFMAYDPHFLGGVNLAVTSTGPGFAQIITAPGAGGGPDIRIFDGTGKMTGEFLAYASGFLGGVNVAAGDVNGDGVSDIITGPGAGGGPDVRVFDGTNFKMIKEFLAYDSSFVGGVYVAAGDTNGDGFADIITGPGFGMAPTVKVFSGKDGSVLQSFNAYDQFFLGGVRVAAADINSDGNADILTAPGAGGGPDIRAFNGTNATMLDDFFAYDQFLLSGVFIGGH